MPPWSKSLILEGDRSEVNRCSLNTQQQLRSLCQQIHTLTGLPSSVLFYYKFTLFSLLVLKKRRNIARPLRLYHQDWLSGIISKLAHRHNP